MIKTNLDYTDIFEVLEAIKKRSGLFLLKNHLDYLFNFLNGYTLLTRTTKIKIKNLDKFEEFSAFIKVELNEEDDNTMGWFGYLHLKYGNETGFHKFFEYLEKFKDTNGFK